MLSISSTEKLSLLRASIAARENAYCPYSKFRVGAALLAEDGSLITGCNVENASYGGAICAERTALTKAVSEGTRKFRAISVSSDVPEPVVSPCGICRQFIREFCGLSTPIFMVGSNFPADTTEAQVEQMVKEGEMVKVMTLGELLPMSFGPEELEMPRQQ